MILQMDLPPAGTPSSAPRRAIPITRRRKAAFMAILNAMMKRKSKNNEYSCSKRTEIYVHSNIKCCLPL